MKRNIIIILFLAFGLPCLAQDMAQCRVTYLGSGWLSNRDMKKREVLWNLDLGGHSSYFYNPDHKALSLEAKQLDSYGTMSDAYALLDKYPASRRYPMEVFCNYPEQGAYTCEYEMLKPLVYTDKMPKTDWTSEKAPNINAPLFKEFPMTLECRIKQKIDESETGYYLIAEIVNILCDEKYLNEQGNPDVEKMNLIAYEPVNHKYIELGKVVGDAFSCGKELK